MGPIARRPFRGSNRESKSCSVVMVIAWILIVSWLGFLVYCWKYGLLKSTKIPTLKEIEDETSNKLNALRGSVVSSISAKASPQEYTWSKDDIHVIFSTDCTPYQDWQTLLVFHSAKVVGQRGPITRIASGCDDAKKVELMELYKKLWPQYHVHFTPDFKKDEKTKKKYDFYNKPYGLKHWLENAEPPLDKDVVIALIDPDMIFMRPLTVNIASMNNNLLSGPWKKEEIFEKVEKGKPAGQTYGLGAPWVNDNHKKFNRGKICGTPDIE